LASAARDLGLGNARSIYRLKAKTTAPPDYQPDRSGALRPLALDGNDLYVMVGSDRAPVNAQAAAPPSGGCTCRTAPAAAQAIPQAGPSGRSTDLARDL